MGDAPNHIKFIKLCSKEQEHIFQYCGCTCVSRRHPGNARFFTLPGWHLAAIVQKFNPGLVPLSWAEKRPRMCFAFSPLPMRTVLSSLVFYQERASCTGDLYIHKLKTCRVKLTWLLLLSPLNIHSIPDGTWTGEHTAPANDEKERDP